MNFETNFLWGSVITFMLALDNNVNEKRSNYLEHKLAEVVNCLPEEAADEIIRETKDSYVHYRATKLKADSTKKLLIAITAITTCVMLYKRR